MIYLKQITDVQKVLVPKGRDVNAHEVFFEVSNDFYHETLRAILNKKNELYYEVLIELPQDIQHGEYEYSFSDEVGKFSSGVFVIVSDKATAAEYNLSHKYEQYQIPYSCEPYIVDHDFTQHIVEHKFEEYWWDPRFFIDVLPDVIWLFPDDYSAVVSVKSNVEWVIK